MPETIAIDRNEAVATVTLRRPEVRNALDPRMIRELSDAFADLAEAPDVRVIVLAGEGKAFCAGADLNWMRSAVDNPVEQNRREAMELARLLQAIYECPRPVIARVHGPAYAGGAGLVAACDLVVAPPEATFCFSEVRVGIAPAVIAPFVVRKIGIAETRRYFITAEVISAADAYRIGLVTDLVDSPGSLDARIRERVEQLLANGPNAMAACKPLVEAAASGDVATALPEMVRQIVELRSGEEGQEGMRAFLEKRRPDWDLRKQHVP